MNRKRISYHHLYAGIGCQVEELPANREDGRNGSLSKVSSPKAESNNDSSCDQKYPNCSNCENAHLSCLTYHSGKQAEIPRNYVAHLEGQVQALTYEVQELRALTHVTPTPHETNSLASDERPPTSDSSARHAQELVASVKNFLVEPSRQPRFLGQSGGITLARLVMAAIHVDNLHTPLVSEHHGHDHSLSTLAAEASLPPRHVANHLVEVYFQFRSPHLPIMERWQVEDVLESAYISMNNHSPPDQVVDRNIFTTFMILAIALCDVPNPPGGRPTQREGCFRSAIGLIDKVITYSNSDLETVRAVLLLSQFIARCPSWGSLWHLTGTALRLCIDIGLHWETQEQIQSMDPGLLQERRRLWYSTYQFDRLLSITLGRPLGVIDESTCVQLPDPRIPSHHHPQLNEYDIHSQQAHNHLFTMSKLESEIKHVQHSQSWTPKIAYPRPNYSAWVKDIQPRLQEWYTTIPQPSKAHPSSIFASQAYWDTIYYNAILLLYRPNSIIPHPSTEELLIAFDASCKLIASVKTLQREGKIDILWKAVHTLFIAGLGVIYGLWHSKEIRDCNPLGNSIFTLHSCASTLSALSENFAGAASCRDAFDSLSSTTIDWLLTSDAEKVRHQNSVDFELQVKVILQQLQPPRGGDGPALKENDNVHDIASTLSTNNFALSEMLSFAAQWPDFLEGDFGTVDPDLMTGTGGNYLGSHTFD
ncbi:fungal-specific transcription factor domain-containing protein [Aspergillus cavernicola]|uniref:Fungal-specific transcription factor domain-containing protein n=1 Tax=Aspergillus cavernicola TaxID=176166 RepID=A0ABR4J1I8_9EURO